MKYLLVLLVLAGAVGGALYFHIPSKLISKLPSLHTPTTSIKLPASLSGKQEASPSGEVAGIATEASTDLRDNTLVKKGIEIGKSVSTVFLSSTDNKDQTIEVQKVVDQVQKQVQNIPSNLLEQAKIQYCTAVLQNATASAEK